MRRISRIDRPIGLLRRQTNTRIPSPYLCLTCKHQITSFSTSTRKAAPSNEKAPFTEKVRQRIWGTDKPPGLEDPYGDTSIFDKTKEQAREAREQELEGPPKRVEESATDNIEDVEGYEPATSWADLQWVGGDPVWQPEEDFEGFAPADAAKDSEQITAALHRAIVEVFALQQVGKPLHELSDYGVNPNDDWTDDVRITPSPSGATLEMPGGASLQQVMELLKANTMDEEDYEVKTTESQEDIVADRSEVDSLKDAVTPSTEPAPENAEPTESQEDTAADRSPEDPLVESKTYCEVISSWDPSWLQISLENPDVKFAVSPINPGLGSCADDKHRS